VDTDLQTVFSTPWFSIQSFLSEGEVEPYYRFNMPRGVVIVPVTPDGNLVLISQYRPVLGRWTLEFPAGGIDHDESPSDAMARELFEETGYRCDSIDLVGQGILRVDREDAENYFFVGRGARLDPAFSPSENIEPKVFTPQEFRTLVMENKFDHIAALPILLLVQYKLGIVLA